MSVIPLARRRSSFDALLVCGFVLALAAPSIDALIRSDEARGPAPEERVAEPPPGLPTGMWTLSTFPERAERHFNDTLGLRDRMLRWRSIAFMFGLGISPTSSSIVGQDRWLAYPGDKSVPVYRGVDPLTEREISNWIALWEQRRDYLAQRGIDYVFVIAPSKESIYPERMPTRFNKVGPTRLDQIAERLAARPDLPVLDLRAALREEKRSDVGDDFTYYPLGTHWNGRGHYAAYRAIAGALHSKFPAIEPYPRAALDRLVFDDNGDSWANRMYIGDLLPQPNIQYRHPLASAASLDISSGQGQGQIRVYSRDQSELPRGVLFHDSFAGNVAELLSANFQSFACQFAPRFDVDFIERTRPDVVIELFVERIFVSWSAPQFTKPSDLDRLSDRMRFQASTRELFHLDLASAPRVLRVMEPTSIAFQDDPVSPRVVVGTTAADARFFPPQIEPRDESDVLLRLEIESPGSRCARLFFRAPDEESYKRMNFRWVLLAPGPNEVYVRFSASEMRAPLYVLLPDASAGYAIRALDARAVEPRR